MNKPLVVTLTVLGVVLLAGAVYYWITPANALLTILPGYDASSTHTHFKHGLAALILALGCGVLAWFLTGKKD